MSVLCRLEKRSERVGLSADEQRYVAFRTIFSFSLMSSRKEAVINYFTLVLSSLLNFIHGTGLHGRLSRRFEQFACLLTP